MRWPRWIAGIAVGATVVGAAACDDMNFANFGVDPDNVANAPEAPRLSASLRADAPSSPAYTARIHVDDPASNEYVALVVSGGAVVSFGGSSSATDFCAVAGTERVFAVTSALGAPSLTVILGTWTGDAAAPPLGPATACATLGPFHATESLVVSIPSASTPITADAGGDADAAIPDGVADARSDVVPDAEPPADAVADSPAGDMGLSDGGDT
jgi:hypothetical protein